MKMRCSHRAGFAVALLFAVLSQLCTVQPAFCETPEEKALKDLKDKQKESEKDKEKEEKPPEPPPLRVSAWCAFRDLSSDVRNPGSFAGKKIKPGEDAWLESRPNSLNWSGFGRPGQWVNIIVEFSNTTKDVPYNGHIEVRLDPAHIENMEANPPYRALYKRDFDVAPQSSNKQFKLSVLCPDPWKEGTETVHILIYPNHGPMLERVLHLYNLNAGDEEFISVISESAGAFHYLMPPPSKSEDDDGKARERLRKVSVVEPNELPLRWHDLMMANIIIIDGPPREPLSAERWEALKSYVQAGGHVLITAGKDPSRLKGPLEDLAGITVREMGEVESLDEINPRLIPARKGWKLPVVNVTANSAVASGGVVFHNHFNQYVEMSKRYYGKGSVTFLPFSLNDPQLQSWGGRTSLVKDILRESHSSIFAAESEEQSHVKVVTGNNYWNRQSTDVLRRESLIALHNALDESFTNDTVVQVQSKESVISFLLLYLLCAVPGNFLLFGWFKRREIAWLAVPLWTAGFYGASYVIGYYGQTGQITVNEVTVVEAGSGREFGISRTFMGLYAPELGNYQLQFPGIKTKDGVFDLQSAPGHLVSLDAAGHTNIDMAITDSDAGLSIEKLAVQQRSTRRLEITHRQWLGGGLTVGVRQSASSQADLEVKNDTGYNLVSPVLILESKAYELSETGILQAGGEARKFSVDMSQGKDVNTAFFGKYVVLGSNTDEKSSNYATKRMQTLSVYMRQHVENYMTTYGGGVVCAWIDIPKGALPVKVGRSGYTLVEPGRLEGITMLLIPINKVRTHTSGVTLSSDLAVRWSTDYNPAANVAPAWKECFGIARMAAIPNANPNAYQAQNHETYLEIKLPENFRDLANQQRSLRIEFKLAARSAPTAVTGTLKGFVWQPDSKNWRELSQIDAMYTVEDGKAYAVPAIDFPFTDYRIRADNDPRVRVKIFFEGGMNQNEKLELRNVKAYVPRE